MELLLETTKGKIAISATFSFLFPAHALGDSLIFNFQLSIFT